MAKQANRKMIGGFVIVAVAIMAASIVIFGSGDLFKETQEFVLYFDGTVRGLNIGSPVLYSGVEVGAVKNVIIRSHLKDEIDRERFEIIADGEEMRDPEENIRKLIEMGLRAQLVTQSFITGQLAIEVGMHPDTPVVLKNLDKDYEEIPTIPSSMAKIIKSLEKLDLAEISVRLISILASVDRIWKNPDIEASLHELKGVLQDARGLMQNVNGKVDPLSDNLNSTLTDTRGLINNVDKEVKPIAGKAKSALDDIGILARHVDGKVDPLSKSVTTALESVDSAFKSIDDLVGKDSPTRADLDETLRELAKTARSLRVLAEYLEQHPDALLKGKGY
jgi:paraquat-inducible protein B